jgi:hypothetical protein
MKENEKELTIRDAITAGISKALSLDPSLNLEVTPEYTQKEVVFNLRGDVNEVLQKIAENCPVGSRDALEAIKNCRSAIFLFKQGVQR